MKKKKKLNQTIIYYKNTKLTLISEIVINYLAFVKNLREIFKMLKLVCKIES